MDDKKVIKKILDEIDFILEIYEAEADLGPYHQDI